MTEESFPIEYSIAGRADSATTSRRMWMLSASRASMWGRMRVAINFSFACRASNMLQILRVALIAKRNFPQNLRISAWGKDGHSALPMGLPAHLDTFRLPQKTEKLVTGR